MDYRNILDVSHTALCAFQSYRDTSFFKAHRLRKELQTKPMSRLFFIHSVAITSNIVIFKDAHTQPLIGRVSLHVAYLYSYYLLFI